MNAPSHALSSPRQYLDRALNRLRDLGLVPEKTEEAPIVELLKRIADLDEARVVAIARTLSQASLFNEVVREQLTSMSLGDRYEDVADSFNSIRDDAKSMVEQLEDGRISTWERLQNVWMKATRGDIPQRFQKIKRSYLDVAKDSQDQIEREHLILNAYLDFRGALKQAEVDALEVLAQAEQALEVAKAALSAAAAAVQAYANGDPAERARLELARDERLRDVQYADDRYQIAKDISDNLTVGYNTSEVIMARLKQTTSAKERVYKQAIAFFGTNETVLTALSASFTGLHGLHESTQTLEAMKRGVSDSLEDLAEIGGKVQEEALRAGYGPTIRMESVKKLVDSVVHYQERSHQIIEEMRVQSTRNAAEIRDAVENGKKQVAALAERVHALPPPPPPLAAARRRLTAPFREKSVANVPASVEAAPLDEVMLAMDVVDTIRHRELIVARELGSGDRRAELTARLKALYAAQGIDVPEHVLAEGVAALEQDRFKYQPPPAGFATALARLYVGRSRWGKPVLGALGLVAAALLGYQLLIAGPRADRIAALPAVLTSQYEETVAAARVPTVEPQAAELLAAGEAALARGDAAAAERAAAELEALRQRLEQQYELRIVSRPGESSGIWRTPEDNPPAQNFYLIVEAIDPRGEALTLPVINEEDGETYRVDRWGLRVDADTYRRVEADKRDDGIIQQNVVGEKRAGFLEPEYSIRTTGSAITSW